jgi:hypothetical protein
VSGEDGAREWDSELAATIYAHLHSRTELSHQMCRQPGHTSVRMTGTNNVDLVVFSDRTGLVRLIATATAALADLDAYAVETDKTPDAAPAA